MIDMPKYLLEKDPWILGEHILDCDVFFFQIPSSCFNNDSSYSFIRKYKKFLATYDKFVMDFYFGKQDSYEVAESILKALVERPGFAVGLDKNILKWSYRLIDFANKVKKMPLQQYSNKQLWQVYLEHDKLHTKLYTYGWLPVSVDMFHNNFTNKLKSYLYSVCDSKEEAEQAFIIFTTPSRKTIVADEREDFLNIYEKYKKYLNKKNMPDALSAALQKHAEKWGHLGYIYAGNVEAFGVRHYLNELKDLAKSKVNSRALLRKEKQQLAIAKQKQAKLYKKLKVSPLYRRLFQAAQDFALSKLVRRHAQLHTLYSLHTSLLPEISKRLDLSRYEVQFMLKGEIKEALLKGKYNKKDIAKRLQHCVLYAEKGFEKIYQGQGEKALRAKVNIKIDKNIKEFSGQTAQPGYGKGKVKIIFRAKDMGKMNKGDILVSVATDPDVVPAMKKAAAIVTEQGGITSHAAIVSRELGIPCIIGTKIATSVLKDGDMVEVDATKGIVRKI